MKRISAYLMILFLCVGCKLESADNDPLSDYSLENYSSRIESDFMEMPMDYLSMAFVLDKYLYGDADEQDSVFFKNIASVMRESTPGEYYLGSFGPISSGGKSLWTEGAQWKIPCSFSKEDRMTVTKSVSDSTWTMTFSGDADLFWSDSPWKTDFTAKVTLRQRKSFYNLWSVTLSGSRVEDEGYSCTFETAEPFVVNVYPNSFTSSVSNSLTGYGFDVKPTGVFTVSFLKDGQLQDFCRMTYDADGRYTVQTSLSGITLSCQK